MDLEALREYKRTADIKLRNRLVMDNVRIVFDVGWTVLSGGKSGKRKSLDAFPPDMFQAGCVALIESIETFDLTKQKDDSSTLFYVHAKWRIRHALQCLFHASKGMNRSQTESGATDAEAWEAMTSIPAPVGKAYPSVDTADRAAAAIDVAYALRDALPADAEAILAYAEDRDVAEAIGIPRDQYRRREAAEQYLAGALARAREGLDDGPGT